jgi:hypothetical protein
MTDASRPALRALVALALFVLLVAAPALAAPVGVTVRVEGRTQTIFDGPVTTDGHDVTTPSGGTHKCDGTNGGAEPSPGPTATAALDDAARQGGFDFDGEYGSFGIDDYFITRIAGDTRDESSEYWSLWIDFAFSDKGGCQKRVRQGDDVLWALVPFSADRALKLEGPTTATTGQPVRVRVSNGADGAGEAAARVGSELTGPDGSATLTFNDAGVYRLKAEKENAVRSNSLVLCVDPPGADPCTSSDRMAPRAEVLLPRFASDISTSRTFPVAWEGVDDPSGSGVAAYEAEVRAAGGEWRTLVGRTSSVSSNFRGALGTEYEVRATAIDRAGNRSGLATDSVLVPIDDRDRELMRFSGGWQRLERRGAWGRFVMRARGGRRVRGSRPSRPTLRLAFSGRSVALIGRRLRRGGRLLFSVDGRRRVLRLRGMPRHRQVLYESGPLAPGRHVLRLTALGGGPVEIDAVGALH